VPLVVVPRPDRCLVQPDHPLAQELQWAFCFDEKAGNQTNVFEYSSIPGPWTGRQTGITGGANSWIETPWGLGMDFSVGTGDVRIELDSPLWDVVLNDFTFMAIFRPSSGDEGSARLFDRAAGGGVPLYLFKISAGTWTMGVDGDFGVANVSVTDGEWTHIAGKRDGDTLTIIRNGGEAIGTDSPATTAASGASELNIGFNTGGGNSFDGALVFAGCWSRVLSDKEIVDHYVDPWAFVRPDPISYFFDIGFVPAVVAPGIQHVFDRQEGNFKDLSMAKRRVKKKDQALLSLWR